MSDAYLEPIVTAVAAYIIKKIIEKIVTGVNKRETARIQKQLLEFFRMQRFRETISQFQFMECPSLSAGRRPGQIFSFAPNPEQN